ncbi:Autophagy-related protein 13 [Rhynchospora pubera]|uniref:Autophagy-related protein 13 n=1 Tax=Rhynchospora pubera TaxID=906938 RepID=A0AAV8BUI0_9POAL|nr:Autophagy-related protein 13 [Rhynchospora pubera]
MAAHSDSGRTTEQIVSQFLSKALHAILAARIPYIHGPTPPPSRHPRKRDRWFHLALGDPPPALEHPSGLIPNGVMEPLVVDILLSPRDDPTMPEAIVERWVAQCEAPAPWSPLHSPAETSSNSFLVKRTYKKSIILLRSIYSVLRLLPAQRVFKMLCASNQSYNHDLTYRVSSFAEPFSRKEEAEFQYHCFAPVETQSGQLAVSVQYRPSLSQFNLEISSLLPPMLITDYVGSPAADPMRAFPSSPSERAGTRSSTSFPLRGSQHGQPSTSAPASAPVFFNRPHSWTGGPSEVPSNRAQHPNHPPTGSYRKPAFNFDEFKFSPPFYMSPTPSPPKFSGSYMQSPLRSETAPVSIPQSGSSKVKVLRSPNLSDPTRNFLPPPSPRSARTTDPSSQDSDSRSFRRPDGLRTSDGYSNMYGTPKGLKDGRDDSGRFSLSGSPRFTFSRSSSRISVPDDLDDPDFSYPFAVDDVDSSDSQARSNDGKEVSDFGHASSSHKSQDAAVGVLVHMLRTAAPLRDSTYSSQSSKSELQEEGLGSTSSFFMSRKASDALEELQSYKSIKEMLLSQSKGKLH